MKRLPKQTGGLSRSPNSSKYFIEVCSPDSVRVKKEIKLVTNSRDIDIQKSKLLLSIMDYQNVVVKIGDSPDIKVEYEMSQHVKNLKGFIKFYCFFTCNDDFREFFKGKREGICKGPGGQMQVIIMPYFPMGSIASYTWTNDNINVLKSCLYAACLCYIDANVKKHFIHNDFHAANIMMKSTKQRSLQFKGEINVKLYGARPWIGDFEKSVIGSESLKDEADFRYDLRKMFFLLPTFIKNINSDEMSKINRFLNSTDDLTSDDFRRDLGNVIAANIVLY
jgi:hypothetical protein